MLNIKSYFLIQDYKFNQAKNLKFIINNIFLNFNYTLTILQLIDIITIPKKI